MSRRIHKATSKIQQNTEMSKFVEVDVASSSDQDSLHESLKPLSKALIDFKRDVKHDLSDFKDDLKKTLKGDIAELRKEVLQELQGQKASLGEAQTQIADLKVKDKKVKEVKDTLLATVRENVALRDKIVDLESRSQ